MAPMLLQRPQPSRNSVSPLVEAAKPHLKPRLTHRLRLNPLLGRSPRLNLPVGDRARRPDPLVLSCGCLRSGPNHSVSRRSSARLRRLSRPPRLPGSVERHLPHLAHPVLRSTGDDQRLVDPRFQVIQRRNGAPRDHPVVSDVSLRPLDTRQFTIGEGGKSGL
jgi:hypothetical protein